MPAFDTLADAAIWVVRAGNKGRYASEFEASGVVAIGSHPIGNLSGLSQQDVAEKLGSLSPGDSAGTVASRAGQLYRFVNEIRVGDLVITPDGSTRELSFGQVLGPYEYRATPLFSDFTHYRHVRWLARRSRDLLPKRVLYSLGSLSTVFKPKGREELLALLQQEEIPPESALGEEPEIEEDNLIADLLSRSEELVWSKLAGLDGYQTQDVVAGLLRAMGYSYVVVSSPGADQGVDINAARDPLGLEQRVKVQVKARPNTKSSAPELVQLAGNLGQGERGIFVSTGGFTREAESHHAARDFRKIDGGELQRLLVEYYERLDEDTKALVPLRRLYFPAD